MKGKFCFSLLLCLLTTLAWSQTRRVTGRVLSDSASAGLSGVNVTVKGASGGAITDARGGYSISVPDNSKTSLVFSSVGYTAQEVTVGAKTVINVTLASSFNTLSDVVVIGYQTVRRRDVLASVSSIGAKDLKDVPLTSAAEALNGRLAGVTATTSQGSPDADVRIRVRGGMSITGDNSPLYIVDGVQVENALNTIAPQDIQSIDVLKDASATAIYGARGANGVIVITTKSGRPGRPVVTLDLYYGQRYLAKRLAVLNPYDYVVYQSERARGSNTDSLTFGKNFGTTWDTLNAYKNIAPVSWQDETFGQTGQSFRAIVGLSGGNKLFTYNFSYTHNDEKAIVVDSKYKRDILNLKADYKITSKIKLGVSGRYTRQDVYGAGVSSDQGSAYNRLRNAVKYRPFLSPNQSIDSADILADPNVGNGLNLINPLLLARAEYRKRSTEDANFSANLNYNLTRHLTFTSTFGYNRNSVIDRQFSDTATPYSIIQGAKKPIAELDTTNRTVYTNSNVFNYTLRGIGGKHDLTLLLGEETYDLRTAAYSDLFRNYPLGIAAGDAFTHTDVATPFVGYPKLGKTRYTSLSFFGRVNYAYKDKYLLSVNVREDGASKFAPGRRWGTFPGGSLAWRVKKESFLQNVSFLNDFKIRVAYGEIGNNRIGDYLYLPNFANDGRYYYGLNGQSVLAYYPSALANDQLRWESLINRNLGFDVSLLKGRLDFSVDVYNNDSKDLLLYVPIASTYGYTSQYQNIGKTNNKGVELQLSAVLLRKPAGFNWNANFNISHNRNKIVALGRNQSSFYPAASWGVSGQPTDYITRIGDPVGAMWGLVTDGFYKVSDFDYNLVTGAYTLKAGVVNNSAIIGVVQPGSIKFQDLNGDGKVDLDNDRKVIGNPTPKFTGGLNQQFSYKRWDASVFVNFVIGGSVYNANKIEFTNGYTVNSNLLAIMQNRWKTVTPDGRTAEYVNGSTVYGIAPDQLALLNANANIWQPLRSAGAFYPHSWAIEDGSFLRLNNVTVAYTFPVKLFTDHNSRLRFYLTGNNLAIITGYSGYDPEVSVRSSGLTPNLDYSAYPKSRSVIFGVQATF